MSDSTFRSHGVSGAPFDSAAAVRAFLVPWQQRALRDGLLCRENLAPDNEPAADFQVVYEAVLKPPALDRVRIELWVTEEGHVGVGLERWSRAARRIGSRYSRRRFVAGREPVPMTPQQLDAALSLAANGDIVVRVRSIPVFGITHIGAAGIAGDEYSAKQLHALLPWLWTAPRSKYSADTSLLRYSSWASMKVAGAGARRV